MDKYSLNARFYPMIFLLAPLIIIGMTYSVEYESCLHALGSLGLTAVLTKFLSNLGRDLGKRKEQKLWEKWGGMPTTQLLSFKNNNIDKITKKRYHKTLLKLSPIETDSFDYENAEIGEVSDIYRSWTKFLITKTRDTKKYSLIFKELISYGFRRNLWGLKTLSLYILNATIIGNYIFQGAILGFDDFFDFPIQFFISEGILLILLLIWIFIINSTWIKIPAFAYAERLLESIDSI